MATGQSMQLTKQVGEYLVAAELCRRGYVAATFSGNVPHYDILASNENGDKYAIQVKSIRGGAWQFDARMYMNIIMKGKKQIIGKKTTEPYPGLICVFVLLDSYGNDKFFIFTWKQLQYMICHFHKKWMDKHGGIRPKKPESFHTSLKPIQLMEFLNNWKYFG